MDKLADGMSDMSVGKKKGALSPEEITKSRRRLSMQATGDLSDLSHLDGVQAENPEEGGTCSAAGGKCFKTWAELSKVGYVPFNPGKVNQDRALCLANYRDDETQAMFGVFDGHGVFGHDVSEFIKRNLAQFIAKEANLDSAPADALKTAFVDCNKKLVKTIDCKFSGSTVVVCYVNGKKVYCANAGDSRAVLATVRNGKLVAENLSEDQKPENPLEKKRIIAKGGRVDACRDIAGNPIGPQRVWLKHQEVPGLAMSRSFGDQIAASVGVIPEPEVLERDLKEEDKFIIIASDGVWEFITSQEAVDIVKDAKSGKEACSALQLESARRWKMEEEVVDDTTAVVVYL